MEKRKQIPFRLSESLNKQLSEVAEFEEVSKNALMNREFKKVIKAYWKNKDFLKWLSENNR